MGQKFRELVQEQLNVGINQKWVENPDGGKLRATQIGIHTLARGQKAYTATWSPGAIADGAEAATTVTVPNAATGDAVIASHDKILTSDLKITGHVSASGTVTAVISNKTGSSVTPASGTLRVLVFDFSECVVPTAGFTYVTGGNGRQVTFTNTSTGTATLSYSWDFGDGSAKSTDEDPVHQYDSDGDYDVVLTTTNSCGSDTDEQTVSVVGA